jgi:hypothetical protein
MTMPRKPTDIVQINLRIRESFRRDLEREAQQANLSLNAEIIRRLDQSFRQQDLAQQVKRLNAVLDAFTLRRQREGSVVAGWIENVLRKRGLDDKNSEKVAEMVRDYLGGREEKS